MSSVPVNIYEAKTRLSKLVHQVAAGDFDAPQPDDPRVAFEGAENA